MSRSPSQRYDLQMGKTGRKVTTALTAAALLLPLAACQGGGSTSTAQSPAPSARTTAASTPTPTPTPTKTHELTVRTVPKHAKLTVTGFGGRTKTATTPWSGSVRGAHAQVEIVKDGYNTVHRQLDLTRRSKLKAWLDPEGLLLSSRWRADSGGNPKQVAYTPDGEELWVTLLVEGELKIFDADTGELRDTISLGEEHGSVEVIFTDDGETAYVSQMETASVYEIDVDSRKIRRKISTEGVWSKVMALSPDERTLYVSNWVSDDVSVIDLDKGETVKRIPTVTKPRGLYVTADGRHLYVAGYEEGAIQRINLRTGEKEVLIRTGSAMRHLVGDPRTKTLYASDMGEDAIFTVDMTTGKASKLAEVDDHPNTIDLALNGRVLFVSCRGRNNPVSYHLPGPEWGSVVLVDTRTGKLLDAVVGGNQTTGLDVSANGNRLAFSDFLDGRIRTYAIPSYKTLINGNGGRVQEHYAELEKD